MAATLTHRAQLGQLRNTAILDDREIVIVAANRHQNWIQMAGFREQLERTLPGEGWQLLNILSFFGEEGLAERRASAANFFLRF